MPSQINQSQISNQRPQMNSNTNTQQPQQPQMNQMTQQQMNYNQTNLSTN